MRHKHRLILDFSKKDRFRFEKKTFKFLLIVQLESVERVNKYLGIQSEGETVTLLRPPPAWPQYGIITFEGSSLVSDNGTHFLRNIWCCVRAQEKVRFPGYLIDGDSVGVKLKL